MAALVPAAPPVLHRSYTVDSPSMHLCMQQLFYTSAVGGAGFYAHAHTYVAVQRERTYVRTAAPFAPPFIQCLLFGDIINIYDI